MHKTDQNVCIRKATLQDAALLTQIEAACFPAAEAATRDRFDARLEAFADHFLICEVDGAVSYTYLTLPTNSRV